MEYLFVMTLSGSTMTGVYLLFRRRLWNKVSARTCYLLARIAILYYLIPLPFLKQWYRQAVWTLVKRGKAYSAQIPLIWTSYTVHTEQKLYVNIFAIIQVVAVVVWLVGAYSKIRERLSASVRRIRFMAGYAEKKMADRHREIIADFKKQYGVRRPVALYHEADAGGTGTVGVLKPVIICRREPGSREAELLLRHEMVHIRRLDVLWEMLLEFAVIVHWFNPIIKKLYDDFERVCECACDEAAMQGMPEDEVTEYMLLLVREAQEQKQPEDMSLSWKSGFSENAERIKERMENLMKKNKWNRFVLGALVAALTFANSMTVFAYRDGLSEIMPIDVSQEEIEKTLDNDTFEFAFDETGEEEVLEFEFMGELQICYDHEFVDEEGNIYPIEEDDSVEPHCNHVYEWGTEAMHRKLSGGGCEVNKYRSQRCVICGQVIRGDLISTTTYVTCPH